MQMSNKCPECGNPNIMQLKSEMICRDCGLVIEDTIFQQDITDIQKVYAQQPRLAIAESRPQNGRIFKQQWLYSAKEKNLQQAQLGLDLVGSRLKIPENTLTEVKLLYKSALDKGLNIGRNNHLILFAAVYAACIISNIPKIPKEIVRNTEITQVQLLRAYKLLKKELLLKVTTVKPTDLVQRFGQRLQLQQETITRATEIIEAMEQKGITTGKKPETIVATAIYIAAKEKKENVTQRKIANIVGVIEVTIRKRSKEALAKQINN